MRKISILFAVFCVVALVANFASAGLLIYSTVAGATVDANGNATVQVDPGATLNCELWAMVTGADGTASDNEKLTAVTGGLQLTGAGTFTAWDAPYAAGTANGYTSTFTAATGAPAVYSSANLLGHGGLTSVTNTGVIYARSVNATTGGEVATLSNAWVPGKGFKLANFTISNVANGDKVDFLKSAATAATSAGMYAFVIDGVSKDGRSASGAPLISTGTLTCNVVPEPATLVLLGMGALALVFVRRRK